MQSSLIPSTLLPTFWSLQVPEAGAPIALEEEESKIQVCTVCLGENAKPGQQVVVKLAWNDGPGDNKETILCVLEWGRKEQESVNLILTEDVTIKHNAGKNVKVYLNGTQYLDFASELGGDSADMEMEPNSAVFKKPANNSNIKGKNGIHNKLGDNKKQKNADVSDEDEEVEAAGEEEGDGGPINQMEEMGNEGDADEEDEEKEGAAPKLVQLKAKSKGAKSTETKDQNKGKQQNQEAARDVKNKKDIKKKEATAAVEDTPNQGKKRAADSSAGDDNQQSAKKNKPQGNSNPGSDSLIDKFLEEIVEYLKKQGGKAKLQEIGKDVKKSPEAPKVKLRKLFLQHPEKFELDVKDNSVSLK